MEIPPPPTSRAEPKPAVSGSAPAVSILIVNYNRADLLADCLRSLAAVAAPDLGIVVVENGSADHSLRVLGEFPRVKVVRSEYNRGFAGGNNLGLTQCSGRYVLLLNNDTIVSPDFLQPLCVYLDQHPQVGVVQGKMVLPRFGYALDVCGSFLTGWGLPYHYGYFKPDGALYERSYPVYSGKGACLMFRRELVERVGGFLFDEEFFCYFEESDLCHRAWLAGWEVHFVPSPPIQHLMGATSGSPQADFVLRHYLRNMAFTLLSNLSWTSRWRILPFFFAMLGVSMLAAAVRCDRAKVAAHWGAITCGLSQHRRIRQRRRLVKSFRRQPDRAIFAHVLRTPRLEYFIKTFTGRLSAYEDEKLP
jgi:GT2 family glycosyltransferase